MKTSLHLLLYRSQFFLEWEMFQTEICIEQQNKNVMFSNIFFLQIDAFYEITWTSMLVLGMPQVTLWRMRIACWILKSTNTCSECVDPYCFPLQPCLRKSASLLWWVYVVCLVYFIHRLPLCVSYDSHNKHYFFKHSTKWLVFLISEQCVLC
jgi:hypothetical protein